MSDIKNNPAVPNVPSGMEEDSPVEKKVFRIHADMDKFNELMFKFEEMENVVGDYFPDDDEMNAMETNPEKYLPFITYLLSQNREMSESVLGADEAAYRKHSEKMMQDFINRHVSLV